MSDTPTKTPTSRVELTPGFQHLPEDYATYVIREETLGPPSLMEGETINFTGCLGLSPIPVLLSIVATFTPPLWIIGSFLWGPLILVGIWKENGHCGVWVTNKRAVYFFGRLFSKQYRVISVPLGEITRVEYARERGISDRILALIDRLFGLRVLRIFVKDPTKVRCSIPRIKTPADILMVDIKASGKLIDHIRKVTNADK